MNQQKMEDYKLVAGIHTVEIEARFPSMIEIPDCLTSCVGEKRLIIINPHDKERREEVARIKINLNRIKPEAETALALLRKNRMESEYTGGEIDDFQTYCDVFRAVAQTIGAMEYRISRIDMRYDTTDQDAYLRYAKLNRYLISLLAVKDSVKNAYHTTELFSERQLSVCIKNKLLEVENYDKSWQSSGYDRSTGRLEVRSKDGLMRGYSDIDIYIDDPIRCAYYEFMVEWPKRWNEALDYIVPVQDKYNAELVREWNSRLLDHSVSEDSPNSFIEFSKDRIFTRDQLSKLYKEITPKFNEEIMTRNFKKRHYIEWFSKADLNRALLRMHDATIKFFGTTSGPNLSEDIPENH